MKCLVVLLGITVSLSNGIASAQQVTVTTPSTAVSESFSERFGVGLNINHPNFSLGFGGPGRAGFGGGGFSGPLDGLSIGIPLRGGKMNANLSLTAGQSFSRGVTTTAPTITLTNGVPGSVFSGTLDPFVTGLFPVIGAGMPISKPPMVSRVRGLMETGQIELQKDSAGNSKLFINELPTRRAQVERDPEPSRTNSDSSNSFRRALEKYAGPKR